MLAVATAIALNAAGRPADAQQLLRDWLGHEPNNIDALRALSSFNLQNNRTTEAEANLKAVLALQPNDPVALNNLAWIYQASNDPAARPLAQKAYLLAPTPQSADTLGWILAKQGNAKVAVLLLTQAGRNLSTDPTIFYHLAVALNEAGEKDKAIAVLNQVLNAPVEFADKPAARKLLQDLDGAKP
jgi:Flp pilus assembly protein TadD